ncbi:hypothetical protein PPUN15366_05860 [Pseudomonas putida]|uniref:hypothetical protein n=1 Tax=Pseudomonas putida TaxID=303 RepID=UPI00235BC48C|nr:hypothetical protein [Pseudomonas putida]GLO38942.1 hypothetical protein PPUN15366_05860 [Pseudomonas putida]HDS0974501.1 hypothetical protein [Pseudomonas putida]
MSEKIIYEHHPVTAERKGELRRKGYKIIDASFAPADYESPEPIKIVKPSDKPSAEALKNALDEKGIRYDGRAGAAALQKLLDDATSAEESVAKLKAALTEKGIQFGDDANLEDLQKLLGEAE